MTICKAISYTKTGFTPKIETWGTELENKINSTIASMDAEGYKFINSSSSNIVPNNVIVFLFFDKK
jgi:hypothetical protein